MNKLIDLGPGSLMFKIDISRAFLQLKVDPGDIDLLGLKQDAYFIINRYHSDTDMAQFSLKK